MTNDMNEDGVTTYGNEIVNSNTKASTNETETTVEHGPQLGLFFRSLESFFKAYKEHAKCKGFAIVKKSTCKGRNDDRRYQTISCDKGMKAYYEKSLKRTNCPASLMARHKNLNPEVRRNREANDIAGFRPCKNIRLLEVQFGGLENLTWLSKDRHNFIEKREVETWFSNVIWVHPRSKVAYKEFNDVVSFDTTYLVNQYKMPFATFVGINHHR
ncbi:protein FAR1-RELATED SEQUENCE 2-like [Pistacia vera]|uniref:protein FAR1-RELATED SEQUENCE 2-like n=1 Tax=Pistacia vera TaxID=55513 RepID=UPI001262E9D2|nr:protein FAR1-RELATED SEQUENCE 2-like [Pistacia vera]